MNEQEKKARLDIYDKLWADGLLLGSDTWNTWKKAWKASRRFHANTTIALNVTPPMDRMKMALAKVTKDKWLTTSELYIELVNASDFVADEYQTSTQLSVALVRYKQDRTVIRKLVISDPHNEFHWLVPSGS